MIALIRTSLAWPPLAILLAIGVGACVALLPFAMPPVAAAAVLPGIGALVVLLARPRVGLLGFVALVTLLPFAVVPVRFGVQLTVLDVVLICLLVGWLAHTAQRGERIDLTRTGIALLIFCVIGVVSFVISAPYAYTPELARRFIKLVLSTLFFIVTFNLVTDTQWLVRNARALIVSGSLAAAIGLAVYSQSPERQVALLSRLQVLGYPSGQEVLRFLPGPNDTYTNILRATGTSIDPNVFAGMLLIVAAVLLGQLFAREPVFPRAGLAVALALAAGCLVATQSRATWLGLVVALGWIATLRYRKAWVLGVAGAFGLLLTSFGQNLIGRVISGFEARDKASALRESEYRNALEIIQAYPILGIGFGASPRLGLFPGVSSQYLLVAEQTGLLGLIAYLMAVAYVLMPSLRFSVGAGRDPRGLVISLQSAFIAALVSGLFDHYWANHAFPHAVALFWYVAALLVRATRLEQEGDTQGTETTAGTSIPAVV
ncbi:MAG TPA: O-antigen ligase family protein [Chloroflexota bacterium]|nr:O-antigen ligase family protein [Chloroflexota bacterium]